MRWRGIWPPRWHPMTGSRPGWRQSYSSQQPARVVGGLRSCVHSPPSRFTRQQDRHVRSPSREDTAESWLLRRRAVPYFRPLYPTSPLHLQKTVRRPRKIAGAIRLDSAVDSLAAPVNPAMISFRQATASGRGLREALPVSRNASPSVEGGTTGRSRNCASLVTCAGNRRSLWD